MNRDEHPGEIAKFLDVVYKNTGYDFRSYSRDSLEKRLHRLMRQSNVASVSSLWIHAQRDAIFMDRLLLSMAVAATSMFRDPQLFAELRNTILPASKGSMLRVWSAGCASGEEAYSLSILLSEEGFESTGRIYATDMNESLVAKAKKGIFPIHAMKTFTNNYLRSGGVNDFSSYYSTGYGKVIFHQSLRDNMTFAQHNLAVDGSFNEFDLILCRNVMIYFDPALQERVHKLLYDSLKPKGILVLGDKESLIFTSLRKSYRALDSKNRIFQKI